VYSRPSPQKKSERRGRGACTQARILTVDVTAFYDYNSFCVCLNYRGSIYVVSRNFFDHYTYGPVHENGSDSLSTENYW